MGEFIRYIVLGVVQGLTELLPVSSSGHLVLVGHGLGIESPGLLVEVVLHVGTLCAVSWAFRRELGRIVAGIFGRDRVGLALCGRLVLATLPVVVLGPVLKDPVHAAFDSPSFAAGMLLVTGALLLTTRWCRRSDRPARWSDALAMGFAQVLALLPGISRSGTTITMGFWRGVERAEVARFSFLMSIPAVLGAALFEILELEPTALAETHLLALGMGFVASFLSGLFAIHLLFKLIDRNRFEWFGVYCLVVGVVMLFVLRGGA